MNWLEKIAKPIMLKDTWNDLTATLNFIADSAQWSLARVSKMDNMPNNNQWFSMSYIGIKHTGHGLSPDYLLNANFRWAGHDNEHYDSTVGSSKLEFVVQLFSSDGDPISDEEVFETATQIAKFVKGHMDDDNFDIPDSSLRPDPSESVSPELVTV